MATLEKTLKKQGTNNWIKGGLSLTFARDGIENFVKTITDQYHRDVMNSLPPGANCSICSTENVIPCKKNNNFCKFDNQACNVHDPNDPNKKSKNCPNAVCDTIRITIINGHRFKGPAWRNTNSQRWCSEPWQLAKCFMSSGCECATTAADTDLPGLLAVVINNKMFDNVVTENLSSKNNIFCQARSVRNAILHKDQDQELKDYINVLNKMLSDSKCLATHPKAIHAKSLLDKILNGQINITTEHERQVRALREIEQKHQQALAKIETEKDAAVKHIRKKLKVAKKVIERGKEEAIADIKTISHDAYSKTKQELKAELIMIYQEDEQLSAPLYPLVQTKHKTIDELYVKPNMQINGKPINSYKDIFKDERKKIFVVGDAGMGETSLCQKMVFIWCKIQSEKVEIMSDDEQAMVQFDFLFYISLREAMTETDIEDMIKNQLLAGEYHEHLQTVLKTEKVLNLLDGLDEWSGTVPSRQKIQVNKGIPAIRTMRNGTILTTTRPWKLEAIQLKSTQIDANIELLGIDEVSSKKLIELMLDHLNEEKNTNKEMNDVVSELKNKQLEHFMTVPLLLTELTCLCYSGKQLGQTKCVIYSQLVELLLELGHTRLHQDTKLQYPKKVVEWKNSSVPLPVCFDNTCQCQDHKPLLYGLSKVAFKAIISENQESALVFERSQAEIYGMTAEDIDISLKIGILSQSAVIKELKSHKKFSFLHKTYQEFFAALLMSVAPTESAQCIQTMQTVCNYKNKCLEMQSIITFISGMSSETTCILMAHIKPFIDNNSVAPEMQKYLYDCLREGWNCSHENKHLQCNKIRISIDYQPEHLELLFQANINNTKGLEVYSLPTSRCLEYLLQLDTLERLDIATYFPSSSCYIGEDDLYTLIQRNTNTLTKLHIGQITLMSRTKLSALLHNVNLLSLLDIWSPTLSQQQVDSLQDFREQRPDIEVNIRNHKILPYTECTD